MGWMCAALCALGCGNGEGEVVDAAVGLSDAAMRPLDVAVVPVDSATVPLDAVATDVGLDAATMVDAAIVDAGLPPARIVFFITNLGIFHPALAMSFPGTSANLAWERSLVDDSTALSPALAPLAAFRRELTVIDGLAMQASLIQRVNVDLAAVMAASLLTGTAVTPVGWMVRPAGPSLDVVLGQHLGGPLPLLQAGMPIYPVTHDREGEGLPPLGSVLAVRKRLAEVAGRGCAFAPSITVPPGAGPFTGLATAIVPEIVTAFRCDLTRVVTLTVPQASALELGFNGGDLHRDFADTCNVRDPDMSSLACRGLVAYAAYAGDHVRRLAEALAAEPAGDGTLLDRTLIVWVSSEASPNHEYKPWNAILVGGRGLGLRTGRYLRMAQDVVTQPSDGGPRQMTGAPHNRALVSLARLFGLDVDAVGVRTILQEGGAPAIDATGPVPAL